MIPKGFKLCIDPGHGMGNRTKGKYDPGAVAGGYQEATVALEWALTLKYVLTQAGIQVFLTRDDATDHTPVGSRDDMARAAGCSHFLSLHCNSADSAAATGVETFWRGPEDKPWAQGIQARLVKATGLKSRGLKTEGQSQHSRLAVLDFAPAGCLAEIGFINNPSDRARITSREVRVAFAEALRDWILAGLLAT